MYPSPIEKQDHLAPVPAAVSTNSGSANESISVSLAQRPAVVNQDSVELARKLRDGSLRSSEELANGLGISRAMLDHLVGAFKLDETSGEPSSKYTFRLLSRETGKPSFFLFDGTLETQLAASADGALLRNAFQTHDLAYRRDLDIDSLCSEFRSLSAQQQRIEMAARFGDDLERLIRLAPEIAFWEHAVSVESLAACIRFLDRQDMVLPFLPADVDPAAAARDYGQACVLLMSSGALQDEPAQAEMLKELHTLCQNRFEETMFKSIRANQERRIDETKTARQVTNAFQQVFELMSFVSPPELGNQVAFRSTLPGKFLDDFAAYPDSSWAGTKLMSTTIFNKYLGAIDTNGYVLVPSMVNGIRQCVQTACNQFSRFQRANLPAVATLGAVATIDAKARAVDLEINAQATKIHDLLKKIPQTYKRDTRSADVVNRLYTEAFYLLAVRMHHYSIRYGSGVWDSFVDLCQLSKEKKISKEKFSLRANDLRKWIPRAMSTELLPRLVAIRDLHVSQRNVSPGMPEKLFKTIPDMDFERRYTAPLMALQHYWKMELDYRDGFADLDVRSPDKTEIVESVGKATSAVPNLTNSGSDEYAFADNIFALGHLEQKVIYALVTVSGSEDARKKGWISQESVLALAKNADLASQAYKEMGNAYAYLRDLAGQPAQQDSCVAMFARHSFLLETAALVGTNMAPEFRKDYSSTAVDSSEQPTPVAPEATLELMEAKRNEDIALESLEPGVHLETVVATAATPVVAARQATATVPIALSAEETQMRKEELENQLVKAEAYGATAKALFGSVATSSSEVMNVLNVRKARDCYDAMLAALGTLLADVRAAGRNGGLPPTLSAATLKKKIKEAESERALMRELLGNQIACIKWPASETGLARLLQKKGMVVIERPAEFAVDLEKSSRRSDGAMQDPMIKLRLAVNAKREDGRKVLVQTFELHIHCEPGLVVNAPKDLLKIKKAHIKDAHIKPWFYRYDTNANPRQIPLVPGSTAMQSVNVPKCDVTGQKGQILQWLATAAAKKP